MTDTPCANPMTVRIRWTRRGEAQHRLDAMQRRADRRGIDFAFTITGPSASEKEASGRVVEYGDVTITAPVLRYAGWSLAAVVTPLPTESDDVHYLITRPPQGAGLPAGWQPTVFTCDHCNTARRRTETFVVRHEDGTMKQVGRNCLGDFLGVDVAGFLSGLAFAQAAVAEMDELEDRGGRGGPVILSLHQIIRATAAVMPVDGWVSRGAAREFGGAATADIVCTWLLDNSTDGDKVRKARPVPDGADELAEAVVAFWRDQEDDRGDYAENARVLAIAGVVPDRGVGLAVSMLPVMQKKQGQARERAAKRANTPPWTTTGRMDLEGTILRADWKSSDWGSYCGITLAMDDGRMVWFRAPAELERRMLGTNEANLTGTGKATTGSRIVIRLTVTPKDDDKTFAFGKRPMLIKVVDVAPVGA